jgi:hypothetical protein
MRPMSIRRTARRRFQFVLDNTVKRPSARKPSKVASPSRTRLRISVSIEDRCRRMESPAALQRSGIRRQSLRELNVDAAGVATLAVAADAFWAWPIYDPKKTDAQRIDPTGTTSFST